MKIRRASENDPDKGIRAWAFVFFVRRSPGENPDKTPIDIAEIGCFVIIFLLLCFASVAYGAIADGSATWRHLMANGTMNDPIKFAQAVGKLRPTTSSGYFWVDGKLSSLTEIPDKSFALCELDAVLQPISCVPMTHELAPID